MADADSLLDVESEGGDVEGLKSESRLGSSVLVSMKELLRRMGEVLNVVDRGEKTEKPKIEDTGSKCDCPATESPSSNRPYGNAQSFTEVDSFLATMSETAKITSQTEKFRSILDNVLNDDELSPTERASRIAKAAQELPARVENPPEYKAVELGDKAVQGVQFVIGRRKGQTTTSVQTVIFDKQNWDVGRAKAWLDKNGMHAAKLDETENSLRFRQADPGEFQEGSFRTIQPGKKSVELKLFKDRTGATRWISFSANAFKDREGEIFSTKALQEAVDWADRSSQRGPLLLYHVPTAEIGQCDFQALEGRMLIESGTFDDSELGRKSAEYFLAHADEEFGMSVGYRYRREDKADGVYDWMQVFERSITPSGDAANPWTRFSAVKEVSMEGKKKEFLEGILGPELTQSVIEQAQNETKSLEDDIAFKSNGDDPEVTPPLVEGEEKKPEAEVKPEGEEEKPEVEEKSLNTEQLTELLKSVLGPVLEEVKSIGERLATVEGQSTKTAEAIKTLSESDDEKISALLRPRVGDPALAGKSATAGGGEELTDEDKKSLEQRGSDPTDAYLAQLTGKKA